MSNYVCREHPTEPVTWKGTGCADCEAAHRPCDRGSNKPARRWRQQYTEPTVTITERN